MADTENAHMADAPPSQNLMSAPPLGGEDSQGKKEKEKEKKEVEEPQPASREWTKLLRVLGEKGVALDELRPAKREERGDVLKGLGFNDSLELLRILNHLDQYFTAPAPAPDWLDLPRTHRLVKSPGAMWDYQPPNNVRLKLNLEDEYQSFKENGGDKQNNPLYAVFSGPGTGKSRLLEEFPQLAADSVDSEDVKKLFNEAVVFTLSLENGSAYVSNSDGEDFEFVLGTRMMALMTNSEFKTFRAQEGPSKYRISDALSKLPPEKSIIFLIVDGLQMIESNENRQACIKTICSHLAGPPDGRYIVGVISATVYSPIEIALGLSPQKRTFLYPEALDGTRIPDFVDIPDKLSWVRLLIENCGGHGRALEALHTTLRSCKVLPFGDFDSTQQDALFFEMVFSEFQSQLGKSYPNWAANRLVSNQPWFRVLEKAIARVPFADVRHIVSDDLTVEDVMNLGMVSWRKDGPLEVPFALCLLLARALAQHGDDPSNPLRNLLRQAYSGLVAVEGTDGWRKWEEFVTRFLCLKSRAFAGNVKLANFHYGAKLSDAAKLASFEVVVQKFEELRNRELENRKVEQTLGQGESSFYDHSRVFLNGKGAEGPDIFCHRKFNNSDQADYEVIGCRHRNETLSLIEFRKEKEKAKQTERDFYLMFVTGDSEDFEFGEQKEGLVKCCSSEYFGNLGRAFSLSPLPPPPPSSSSSSSSPGYLNPFFEAFESAISEQSGKKRKLG